MKQSLSELRRGKKLRQCEVAETLNVDQTTVSKWESGDALPRAQKLFDLAELYGVKVDDIDFKTKEKT